MKTYAAPGITTKRGTTRKSVAGMGEVLDKLTELAEACGDMTPAWDELGRMWERRQEGVFASPQSYGWVGFAASTLREHQSPLVDEGIMRAGMTLAAPRYSDKQMVAFGAPKKNRRVQNVATLNTVGHRDRGGSMVRQRVVVPKLSSRERADWIEVIDKHIKAAIR